jgi:hypothetical protein
MPGATDTCTHCHTRAGQRDILRNLVTYADDETSTESVTTLTMQTAAIHWHARADIRVEYIATDAKRETIPCIKVTDAGGGHRVFRRRRHGAACGHNCQQMDCLDCHSRPAHVLPSADRAVDALLASGGASRAAFARRKIWRRSRPSIRVRTPRRPPSRRICASRSKLLIRSSRQKWRRDRVLSSSTVTTCFRDESDLGHV